MLKRTKTRPRGLWAHFGPFWGRPQKLGSNTQGTQLHPAGAVWGVLKRTRIHSFRRRCCPFGSLRRFKKDLTVCFFQSSPLASLDCAA